MNIEKLGPSSSIVDFEYFIRKEAQNLERFAAEMRKHRHRMLGNGRAASDDDILLGCYLHMQSLKSMIEQMHDAEEIIKDMEDDEVEQAYARGELNSLKSAFATLAKQIYISIETWIDLEGKSGRYGRPELHREIFYSASGQQKVASAQPLMFKPFDSDIFAKVF